jgi:hypothetical protein
MLALAMILAAGVMVESGPRNASMEVGERLDLSGEWEGTWQHAGGWLMPAASTPFTDKSIMGEMPGGVIFIRLASITDKGEGRFHITEEGEFLGIYKQHDGRVILCFRPARDGYPTSFRGGKGQHLLILRRPKNETKK